MVDSTVLPLASAQFTDDEGLPLAGGKLYTKLASNPSTNAPVYTDEDLLVAHPNPIILDDYGFPLLGQIWLDPTVRYYFDLRDSADNPIRTFDLIFDPLLKQKAKARVYAGNPNGNVAGTAGVVGGVNADMIWDSVANILYVCTTTGNAATAVWTATTGTFPGNIAFSGVISPNSISTDQDDYNPTGLSAASSIRQNLGASCKINGLAGGEAGRLMTIHNISNDFRLVLAHEASSSSASNRFSFSNDENEDVFIEPKRSLTLQYDAITGRWRLQAPPLPKTIGRIGFIENLGLAVSVSGNAITIALKTASGNDPSKDDVVRVAFRKSPVTDGGFNLRKITAALSMTVSNGSTLGFANNETNRISVCLIDNNGTPELAVVNDAGVVIEDRLISTTAEGGSGGADTRNVIYSSTARANVPIRMIGSFVIQTGATAGQWGNAPTRISLVEDNPTQPWKNTIKSCGQVAGDGTALNEGFNCGAITDNSAGDVTIDFAVAMAATTWFAGVAPQEGSSGASRFGNLDETALSASNIRLQSRNSTATAVDPNMHVFMVAGR